VSKSEASSSNKEQNQRWHQV